MKKETSPSTGEWSEPPKAPRALRIVVADDDRDTVRTLMMVLRHEGHEVYGVYRGTDVLMAINSFEPDAALIDVNMPRISGFEVARLVREKPRRKRLLLIAISGVYKSGADKALSQVVGFDHHITKPYDIQEVLALLSPLQLPTQDDERAG